MSQTNYTRTPIRYEDGEFTAAVITPTGARVEFWGRNHLDVETQMDDYICNHLARSWQCSEEDAADVLAALNLDAGSNACLTGYSFSNAEGYNQEVDRFDTDELALEEIELGAVFQPELVLFY